MEGQTAQPPSDPSVAAAAAYPRWVMLEHDLKIQTTEGSSCCTSTLEAARTSTGDLIQISLRLAEPPGVSCVCLHIPAGFRTIYPRVVAAHGDSVLIEVRHGCTEDYFVYSAGAAAAEPPRPPSMSLLPPSPHGRPAALVRCDEDMVVAAQLESELAEPNTPELLREANLSLFRSGQWSVKRLQIMYHDATVVPEYQNLWHAVVPLGDGLLCWVDPWEHGVVLCDAFKVEEASRLQYLPLPSDNMWGMPSNRNVCATAGGDALRFVNIFARCCCGGAGASSCERSCHAYIIETWTMRIGNGNMEWVKDGIVDASEIWALDSYKGLPCFPLDHPVVSLDDPEVICFWLHEPPEDNYGHYNDTTVDVLMVNTRSREIHCVSRYEDGLSQSGHGLIPSNVSCFFNSYLGSSGTATFTGKRKVDIERPPLDVVDKQLIREDDDSRKRTKLASFTQASVQASEIFEAYQEIPSYGLDHHDELKVYRILSRDNCRQFRSLLRLPKNLRKDWLLMEIKASID